MPDLTPALLARAGRTLYGRQWQAEMADDVGRNWKTVSRWASGESPVPAWVGPRLANLLELRAMDIRHLLEDLRPLTREAAE